MPLRILRLPSSPIRDTRYRYSQPPIPFDQMTGWGIVEREVPIDFFSCSDHPNHPRCFNPVFYESNDHDPFSNDWGLYDFFQSGSRGSMNWSCTRSPRPTNGRRYRVTCFTWRNPFTRTIRNPIQRLPAFPSPRQNWRVQNVSDSGLGHNCQYFVYLIARETEWATDFDGVLDWDPTGRGGVIIPCYGPITEFEARYEYSLGGTDFFSYWITCNGFGMYPGEPFPNFRLVGFDKLVSYNFVRLVRNDFASFLNPPLPRSFRPHRELWYYPPGVNLDYGRQQVVTVGTDEPKPRYLLTAPFGYAWYQILDASEIPPYTYPDGQIAFYGNVCPVRPGPPPPLVPPRRNEDDPPMAGCSCADIEAIVRRRMAALFDVLGFPATDDHKISVAPEQLIKSLGQRTFQNNNNGEIEVSNLKDLVAALVSANYHRAGLHRLPAKVPKNLAADRSSHDQETIDDAQSWQVWLVKQIDALIGQFPIKINVRNSETNETKELAFKNLAEAVAEIAGMNLAIATDADLAAQLSLRAVIEASKAGNAAIIAQDYARANAQYMGYKGNQVSRKVMSTINPGTSKISEMLQASEQSIIGWKWEGDDSLQATLNQLLLAAGIIKAALVTPFEPEGAFLGDAIKQSNASTSTDADATWEQFLTDRRTPPANREVDNTPDLEIRDITPPRPDAQ